MERKGHIKYIIPILIGIAGIIALLYFNEWLSYQQCKIYDSYERELSFLSHYPQSEYSSDVRNLIKKYEKRFVDERFNSLKVPTSVYNFMLDEYLASYKEYSSVFPSGSLRWDVARFINGVQEENDFHKIGKVGNVSLEACDNYLEKYPFGSHLKEVNYLKATITNKDYSLNNGAQPYSKYYGSNARSGGCRVIINSSSNRDCIVTVKYNNSDGRVAGHVYVAKGESAEIPLPSGRTYQVFFYSGEGWYPEQEMPKGVMGGFLFNIGFSYDKTPFYLDYGESMTYTLTPTTNGNFTPTQTDQNSFF